MTDALSIRLQGSEGAADVQTHLTDRVGFCRIHPARAKGLALELIRLGRRSCILSWTCGEAGGTELFLLDDTLEPGDVILTSNALRNGGCDDYERTGEVRQEAFGRRLSTIFPSPIRQFLSI